MATTKQRTATVEQRAEPDNDDGALTDLQRDRITALRQNFKWGPEAIAQAVKLPVEAVRRFLAPPQPPALHIVRPGEQASTNTPTLALYDAARNVLAAIVRIDEVKTIRDQAVALQVYAQHAQDTTLLDRATEYRLLAERRAGEILKLTVKNKGGGDRRSNHRSSGATGDRPTLDQLGINKSQSSRWQKLADLAPRAFETYVADAKKRANKNLDASGNQQLGGSGDDEYFTPSKYVKAVRDVLGTIDLDPASCDEAQATVRAVHYFTKDDNGLTQDWHGRVFLNPPFSRPLLRPFVQHLIHEYKSGRVSEAILLGFSNTSTEWFQEAMAVASAICFTNTNIAFIHRTKGQMGRSAIGQAFLYFGSDVEKFARRFSEFGFVMILFKPRQAVVLPSGAFTRLQLVSITALDDWLRQRVA
jgi:DNA N-6-adenine-methyltransferase (Dam)